MWQFFIKGGIVMIPLGLCSITALIIIVERLLFYYKANRWDERETKLFKVYLSQGKLTEAKTVTASWDSAFGRVADAILDHLKLSSKSLEAIAESTGYTELKKFERGLSVLDTIVTASPLLGLLGTVTGIIRAFGALAEVSQNQAAHLSSGIAEALYTTAFGLSIAIPTLFCVNFFYKIVERQAQKLTSESQELLGIIERNSGGRDEIAD
jgi:biopolymer transport protein ExbB